MDSEARHDPVPPTGAASERAQRTTTTSPAGDVRCEALAQRGSREEFFERVVHLTQFANLDPAGLEVAEEGRDLVRA